MQLPAKEFVNRARDFIVTAYCCSIQEVSRYRGCTRPMVPVRQRQAHKMGYMLGDQTYYEALVTPPYKGLPRVPHWKGPTPRPGLILQSSLEPGALGCRPAPAAPSLRHPPPRYPPNAATSHSPVHAALHAVAHHDAHLRHWPGPRMAPASLLRVAPLQPVSARQWQPVTVREPLAAIALTHRGAGAAAGRCRLRRCMGL